MSRKAETDTVSEQILEILLKAQKYVESQGGRLSARIIIWPSQIVNVHVDYERVPNMRAGGFGIGTSKGDLRRLRRDLEQEFDYLFGPGWREQE
jgi:hypothetical protein